MPSLRCRPRVELLEERTTPRVFTATDQATLAAAITASNTNGESDTIRIRRDIDLTGTALPSFTADGGHTVTLEGNGRVLQRVGSVAFRVLHNNGAGLTIRQLHVTGGIATSDGGGGIFNQTGFLALDRTRVVGNRAIGNTVGGGVYNHAGAVLSIRDSFIAGNTSATFGGGVRNVGLITRVESSTFADNLAEADGGGGLCNFFGGVVDLIRNSTFTGNTAVRGGAICNHGIVSLLNCTLVGNRAAITGGGLENDNIVPRMVNCIVAGNVNGDIYPNPPVVGWANLVGGEPRVGRLRNNGGPTPTMALLPNSPARRLGVVVGAPRTDQRGFPRPVGGPIDIGAFQSSR